MNNDRAQQLSTSQKWNEQVSQSFIEVAFESFQKLNWNFYSNPNPSQVFLQRRSLRICGCPLGSPIS